MPPTAEQARAGYVKLWNKAAVRADKVGDAKAIARRILDHRDTYKAVQAKTGVPWPMIGALHNRESGLSFAGHLHNGDSLRGYTRQVPAGRPRVGHGPPFTWAESAVDALTMPGHRLDQVKTWSVERILYECEKYNGWGYLGRCNSPYLWSWTDQYHGGKYIADHVFSANAWDKQAGCAAVFKVLIAIDAEAASLFRLAPREAVPSADAKKEASRQARAVRASGGAIAAGGASGEAAKQSGTLQDGHAAFVHPLVLWGVIGFGIAIVIVAGILIARKHRLVVEAWTGIEQRVPWIEAKATALWGWLLGRLQA